MTDTDFTVVSNGCCQDGNNHSVRMRESVSKQDVRDSATVWVTIPHQ